VGERKGMGAVKGPVFWCEESGGRRKGGGWTVGGVLVGVIDSIPGCRGKVCVFGGLSLFFVMLASC